MQPKALTEEDILFIRENYGKMSSKAMAVALDTKVANVYNVLKKLPKPNTAAMTSLQRPAAVYSNKKTGLGMYP